jgi:hypothetical protein
MRLRIPKSLLSRYRQKPQPPAGQLRARQFIHEAAQTNAMCDRLTPKQQPVPAKAVKKHQSIQWLDTRILKNHRSEPQIVQTPIYSEAP